eukprot:954501-Pyramimonas_sp.AAC.1
MQLHICHPLSLVLNWATVLVSEARRTARAPKKWPRLFPFIEALRPWWPTPICGSMHVDEDDGWGDRFALAFQAPAGEQI